MKPENLEYKDFAQFDIRVGEVTNVEPVPKSKKLLKLTMSFGLEIGSRTILAGIAQAKAYGEVVKAKDMTTGSEVDVWKDSCLIGQRILAVLNLAPREMFGIMSHGMILAGHSEDKLWLATCGASSPGTEIG